MKKAFYLLLGGALVPLLLLSIVLTAALKPKTAISSKPALLETQLTPLPFALSLTSPPPTPLPPRTEKGPGIDQPRSDPLSNETPTQPVEPKKPVCFGPTAMTILAVGTDNREDTYLYGLADVVRVVRADFVNPQISIFALPRDLWVKIPGIEDHYGITHGKLNQAYLYGNPGMGYFDGVGEGLGLTAQTLAVNFGFEMDYYLGVNMQTFIELVDAVGGIDITLDEAIDGIPEGAEGMEEQFFPAGDHHLNGEAALRLARLRTNYDDLTRIDHQTMLLSSLWDRLTRPGVIVDLPELITALKGGVLSDLGARQIAQLVCLSAYLDLDDLTFISLPSEILKTGRVYSPHLKKSIAVLRADEEAVRRLVAAFQGVGGTTTLSVFQQTPRSK